MNDNTQNNLRHVFTQFAAATRHCFAYEQKANDEKCSGAANLFKALTRSYSIQSASMLMTADGIHDTTDNIRQALIDGLGSLLTILPNYIKKAQEDGSELARVALEWSQGSGQSQIDLLEKALDQLEAGENCTLEKLHVCSACGYLIEGDPLDKCPNCGVSEKLIAAVE
jgi:rubrerythrin